MKHSTTTDFDPCYVPVPPRRCARCDQRLAQMNHHTLCFACQRLDSMRPVSGPRLREDKALCAEPHCGQATSSPTGYCNTHRIENNLVVRNGVVEYKQPANAAGDTLRSPRLEMRPGRQCAVDGCDNLTRSTNGRCRTHKNIRMGTPLRNGHTYGLLTDRRTA